MSGDDTVRGAKKMFEKRVPESPVKFGQVYRAIEDVYTSGGIQYKGPMSSGFNCTIPKGTRIVIQNDPVPGAMAVLATPLNYKELEDQLVPQKDLKNESYDFYGIDVHLNILNTRFVKEDVKEIKFDDEYMQEIWDTAAKMYKERKEKPWLYEY